MSVEFDIESFTVALDGIRFQRRMTWRGVARESGAAVATVHRVANGRKLDADTLARLIAWSGLNFSDYILKKD